MCSKQLGDLDAVRISLANTGVALVREISEIAASHHSKSDHRDILAYEASLVNDALRHLSGESNQEPLLKESVLLGPWGQSCFSTQDLIVRKVKEWWEAAKLCTNT